MLRRFFLEDWRLKALSLAIAFAMYVFVNYETRSEVGFPVPVELANIPPWLTLTAQPPSAAYLRVVGPRTRIGAVDREELRFRIDLADAQEGVSTYNLNAGDLGLPAGIEARSVSPSSISLTLEATRRRVVPVNPAFSGSLPPGLVLAGIRVAPARTEVSGPASSVDAIEAAWTSRISLAGRTESFVETAALDFRGAQASADASNAVEVFVDIRKTPLTIKTDGVVVETRGVQGRSIQVRPASVTVVLEGGYGALRRLQRQRDIGAYVDVEGLEPGVYERPVSISYSGGEVTAARAVPDRVAVRLATDRIPEPAPAPKPAPAPAPKPAPAPAPQPTLAPAPAQPTPAPAP